MANEKTDFEYLKWILNRDFICKDKEWMKELKEAKKKKPQIVHIRKGRGVTDYELYDFGSKENYRLLPFFDNTYKHPVFPNAPAGLIDFCDYIILAEFQSSLYIILVEMKRTNSSHAKAQLQAARTFMDYVLKSAERIKDDNSMEDFDRRKVSFRRVIILQNEKEPLNAHFPKNDKKDHKNKKAQDYAPGKNDIIPYETGDFFDIREVI